MIFIFNGDGSLIKCINEPVYQNSHLANRIVFIAPIGQRTSVTVGFVLPNGLRTPVSLVPNMTSVGELQKVLDENHHKFSAFEMLLPRTVTEYAGVVTCQFYVYAQNGQDASILSTFSTTFNVQKGAPIILPPTPTQTIYEQILAALTSIGGDITDLETRLANVEEDTEDLFARVEAIEELIPEEADEDNQLADKDYVDTKAQTAETNAKDYADEEIAELKAYTDGEIADLKDYTDGELGGKQDTLMSGVTIKTINHQSVLGAGNIDIQGGGGDPELEERVEAIEAVIPAEATEENPLVDQATLNNAIQTATADFRGEWANFNAVPTNYTQYPADASGNKKPNANDYITVADLSDYDTTRHWTSANAPEMQLPDYGESTKTYTLGDYTITLAPTTQSPDMTAQFKAVKNGVTEAFYIDGVWQEQGSINWTTADENASNSAIRLVLHDNGGYYPHAGTWLMKFTGNWDTVGKSGWLPEYRVSDKPLTQAQLTALNSGITARKVAEIAEKLKASDLKTLNGKSLANSPYEPYEENIQTFVAVACTTSTTVDNVTVPSLNSAQLTAIRNALSNYAVPFVAWTVNSKTIIVQPQLVSLDTSLPIQLIIPNLATPSVKYLVSYTSSEITVTPIIKGIDESTGLTLNNGEVGIDQTVIATAEALEEVEETLSDAIETLDNSVVKHTVQTLTDAQKRQARTNIGAGTPVKMTIWGDDE